MVGTVRFWRLGWLAWVRAAGVFLLVAAWSLHHIQGAAERVDELRHAHPERDIVVDSAGDVRGRWDAGSARQSRLTSR
jgi:hypothetical protein